MLNSVNESEIRADWKARLLSTEPADRVAAESAPRGLYVASGFAPPRQFFWFDSPWSAAAAQLILIAPHCPSSRRVCEYYFGRTKAGRERGDEIRRDLCQRSGLD